VRAPLAGLAQVGAQPEAAQPQGGGEADLRGGARVDLLAVEVGGQQRAGADRLDVAGADRGDELAVGALAIGGRDLGGIGQAPRVDRLDDGGQRRQVDVWRSSGGRPR